MRPQDVMNDGSSWRVWVGGDHEPGRGGRAHGGRGRAQGSGQGAPRPGVRVSVDTAAAEATLGQGLSRDGSLGQVNEEVGKAAVEAVYLDRASIGLNIAGGPSRGSTGHERRGAIRWTGGNGACGAWEAHPATSAGTLDAFEGGSRHCHQLAGAMVASPPASVYTPLAVGAYRQHPRFAAVILQTKRRTSHRDRRLASCPRALALREFCLRLRPGRSLHIVLRPGRNLHYCVIP